MTNKPEQTTDSPTKEKKKGTEETIITEVNRVRELMKLPKLEFDSFLRNYSLEVLQNKQMPQIPVVNDTVYLSCFHFVQGLHRYTAEKWVERWLKEKETREVLLSPGNRGAVCMFSNPVDKSNYIALFVATAFV